MIIKREKTEKSYFLKLFSVEEIKEEGHVLVSEGSLISSGLSLVLSGRMVVKSENCILHKIDKNHFVQSIEWSARRNESALDKYQVRIEVEDTPVNILHLSGNVLDHIMDTRPDLRLIMECLVAKDVSMKLYMMNKMIGDTDVAISKTKNKQSESVKKSSSVDAINTGWKGLIRLPLKKV